MTARVRGVRTGAIVAAERLPLSGSTSANTGFAPAFTTQDTVVIAENDEVLTFPGGPDWCHPAKLIKYPTGGHRFNGPELEDALRKIVTGANQKISA